MAKGRRSEVVLSIETYAPGSPEALLSGPGEAASRPCFTPLTARLVAVAMLNPATGRGKIWYEHPGASPGRTDDGAIDLVPSTEREILLGSWAAIVRFRRIITFNGRHFACPFLMLRSAFLGVPPARNLLPYRFSAGEHCDLLDQLTFYGATRKSPLADYCREFGIPHPLLSHSPADTATLIAEGRYLEIALGAAGTLRATAELYRRWAELFSF